MQGKVTLSEPGPDCSNPNSDQHTVQMIDGVPHVLGLADTWPIESTLMSTEISAICACNHFVLVAQEHSSGNTALSRISLPDMQLQSTRKMSHAISRMWLNCDATQVAFIDLQVRKRTVTVKLTIYSRDTWAVRHDSPLDQH